MTSEVSQIHMAAQTLQALPLAVLQDHPKNPRLMFRRDVVQAIASEIRVAGFKPVHGLLVRPLGDQYQIISGHHRKMACIEVGLNEVPCFIEEMTDEEAHKRLVKENRQSELSKLEIGMYLRDTVQGAKGGRGKKGGLSEAAAEIGIDRKEAESLITAAEVYLYVTKNPEDIKVGDIPHVSLSQVLIEKHNYLAEIASATQSAWIPLVQWLLNDPKQATIAKIKAKVDVIKRAVPSIPEWWDVDVSKLAALAISNEKEAERRASVFELAGKLHDSLGVVEIFTHSETGEKTERDGREYYVLQANPVQFDQQQYFRADVLRNTTIPSADAVRRIHSDILKHTANSSDQSERLAPVLTEEEQSELDQRIQEMQAAEWRESIARKVHHGDCLEAMERWNGGPIKLLLSDPPYGMDFQSNRRVVSEKADKIASDGDYEAAMCLTADMLAVAIPNLADHAHVILFCNDEGVFRLRQVIENAGLTFKRILTWVKPCHTSGDLFGSFAPRKELAIHAVMGRPSVSPRRDDVFIQDHVEKETDHPTEKPLSLLKSWIECTTDSGDLVIDPFSGVGSTLVAAASIGREVWGAELSADYHRQAVQRLVSALGGAA